MKLEALMFFLFLHISSLITQAYNNDVGISSGLATNLSALKPFLCFHSFLFGHDIGYDTLDQTKLHNADKQFLSCLRTIPGRVNQNIYILGLVRFLIPYRDIFLIRKVTQGKRGKEIAPEIIMKEIKERNADMDRNR